MIDQSDMYTHVLSVFTEKKVGHACSTHRSCCGELREVVELRMRLDELEVSWVKT